MVKKSSSIAQQKANHVHVIQCKLQSCVLCIKRRIKKI
uniref:Uncharacterized protein n=1 Tax=Anguilla anguilla TaxID=7936 RepID=A0A0E9U3Z4_ANGAN